MLARPHVLLVTLLVGATGGNGAAAAELGQGQRPARVPNTRQQRWCCTTATTAMPPALSANFAPACGHPCAPQVCNALAAEALPLVLDRLADPATAIIVSVTVVLFFGEGLRALCGALPPH